MQLRWLIRKYHRPVIMKEGTPRPVVIHNPIVEDEPVLQYHDESYTGTWRDIPVVIEKDYERI